MGKDWSRARTETVSPFARDIPCWVLLFAVICGFTAARPAAVPQGTPAARTCHVPCLSALGSLCRTEVSFTSGDYVGFGTQALHQPCAFARPSVKIAHLPHSPG